MIARRRAIWALPAALAAMVAALAFTGAAAAPLLGDPGAIVRWGLPVATVVAELALSVTVGALLVATGILGPRAAAPRRHRTESTRPQRTEPTSGALTHTGSAPIRDPWTLSLQIAAAAAAVWTVSATAQAIFGYADIAGTSLTDPTFGSQLWTFLTTINAGQQRALVVLAAAATCALALGVSSLTGAAWTLAVAMFAFVPMALGGHAAGAANHESAVTAAGLHYAAAAIWVGGLAALVILQPRLPVASEPGSRRVSLGVVARRYSVVAAWAFAIVAFSGVINAWLRIGSPAQLASRYGVLVLIKTMLLLVLGGFGWWYRRRIIGRLDDPAVASARRRSWWSLVGVEVIIMGVVMGVAVALADSPTPVPQTAPTALQASPARLITGYELPPESTPLQWLTQWRPDLLMLCAAGLLGVCYLLGVRRLARRGDRWPIGRTIAMVGGCVLLVWVSSGGPAVYGRTLFSGHMLQHMLLAMVVPLFFVVAAPITLALRTLARRTDGTRGLREWLLAFLGSRWVRFFAHPIVAAINFAGSMIVFYYTDAFQLALRTHVGHEIMMIHFILVGYLFGNALIGVDPGPARPSYPMRLVLLFATMAFHAFFGLAIMNSTVLMVPEWFGVMGRPWGASALADQQTGGGIAWGIGELPTLFLAVMVAIGWARDDERTARRLDRQADRDHDAALTEYNTMLAGLAARDGARSADDATTAPAEDRSAAE